MELKNSDIEMIKGLLAQIAKPSDEKHLKDNGIMNDLDEYLWKNLTAFMVYSKKNISDIAREIGISHNTLNDFMRKNRHTNYRSKLKIKSYLDQEFIKALEMFKEKNNEENSDV